MTCKRLAFSALCLLTLTLPGWRAQTATAGKPSPPPPPPTPPFRYNLTLLGTLGGLTSVALGQNNLGDVVGSSKISPDSTRSAGFLWPAGSGQMININTLLGYNDFDNGWNITSVAAVNDSMEFAVQAYHRTGGVVDRKSLMILIPSAGTWTQWEIAWLAGGTSSAVGHIIAMNNSGDIIGQRELDGGGAVHFVWTKEAGMRDLVGPNGRRVLAQALSDRTQGSFTVVGAFYADPVIPVTGWRSTVTASSNAAPVIQDLGFLYQDTRTKGASNAWGVNNLGVIAGETTAARDETFAGLYSGGKWTSLGSLNPAKNASFTDSWAQAINDEGYVVGWTSTSSTTWSVTQRPFIYHSSFKMYSLETIINNLPADYQTKLDPVGINQNKRIFGNINLTNGSMAYVLTIVP